MSHRMGKTNYEYQLKFQCLRLCDAYKDEIFLFCFQERPLLQKQAIKELLDPRLMNCYSEQEVYCMALCAYLCIRRDPNSRPRMSQVCCSSSSEKYFKS